MAGRFDGRVVIVTGAAGGIGRAACLRFGSEGAKVVAVDLPSAALDAVAAEVIALGSEAIAAPADVTQSDQVKRYVDSAKNRFGRIDALFNNAGIEGWAADTAFAAAV